MIGLTACSTTTVSTWEPPVPPPVDAAVAALMPGGSYEVVGALVMQGKPTYAIDGYVDFGSAPDGVACAAEYEVTDVRPDTTAELTVSRTVRAPGGPSWWADVSTHDPSVSKRPVEWRESSDPSAAGLPLLFVPAIIASDFSPGVVEGAGNDHLCAIGVMPRFMRLTDEQPSSGARLAFDTALVEQTTLSARGRWVEEYLTAAGVTGETYDRAAAMFFELSKVSFQTLIKDTVVEMRNLDNGGFEIVQVREGKSMLTLTFTPAERRTITAPAAQTFFERIASRTATEGYDALLDELLGQAPLPE